jgi:DNA-binding NarL/FixJ family response regulator
MKKRVKKILLVSSFYDAYIFEQDGNFSEQIFGEYREFNLSSVPRIIHVPTIEAALKKLSEDKFDLVITMMRIGETIPYHLSKSIKEKYPELPVLLLLNVQSDIALINSNVDKMKYIDDVFIWNGDSKLFLAMIKSIEDRLNLEEDTSNSFISVILIVEDSVIFYSSYLPILYTEIMMQTQRIIEQEINDMNKRYRMRSRPKVILVHNYEDAVNIFKKYKDYIIGVITDIEYPVNGVSNPQAGINLMKLIRSADSHLPVLLQSSDNQWEHYIENFHAQFLSKTSKSLLQDLRKFIHFYLGYGEIVFRDERGNEYTRANTLQELEKCLNTIPDSSLLYHSNYNHFSTWLMAHGEISAARQIKEIRPWVFYTTKELRNYLRGIFREVRMEKSRGKIVNFNPENLTIRNQVVKLSEGSLGGKGRGLAFLNNLLSIIASEEKYESIFITLPLTAIIGTHEYDEFIERNKITSAITALSDREIADLFSAGVLSDELRAKLSIFLDYFRKPIAVRSSGLLEDSQAQPFAGIYSTYMLPNNHPDKEVRFGRLTQAIKLVYASVFMKTARSYIESVNYKVEEEKMAVIIQEVAGAEHKGLFYPHISGVGQSYNFYPTHSLKHEDGICSIAMGLGISVVEGINIYHFSPKYPQIQAVSETELVSKSQKHFYALDMNSLEFDLREGEEVNLRKVRLKEAESHKTLNNLVSTWDYDNSRFVDGMEERGLKVLTFANILKYNHIPLADLLDDFLSIGQISMGAPVEIEFAVTLHKSQNKLATFSILQIRPLTTNYEQVRINRDELNQSELILQTSSCMGFGKKDNIYDIIFVHPKRFDNTKTISMLDELDKLNEEMRLEGRPYILIGFGRWGTRDEFLGIPVKWENINMAKIIVEAELPNFRVDPSQGTHFFHNMVAMNIGYFSVGINKSDNMIDWDFLLNHPARKEGSFFVHIQSTKPFEVLMDGETNTAIIKKDI